MRRLSLRGRPIRAIVASLLALSAGLVALFHLTTWPIAALVGGRLWELGGILPALLVTLAYLAGASLLFIGGIMLLQGYYGMSARFIIAGGILSGFQLVELFLAIPAAILGGTIPPPEDELTFK